MNDFKSRFEKHRQEYFKRFNETKLKEQSERDYIIDKWNQTYSCVERKSFSKVKLRFVQDNKELIQLFDVTKYPHYPTKSDLDELYSIRAQNKYFSTFHSIDDIERMYQIPFLKKDVLDVFLEEKLNQLNSYGYDFSKINESLKQKNFPSLQEFTCAEYMSKNYFDFIYKIERTINILYKIEYLKNKKNL